MKDLRECRDCGRVLPHRSYRKQCASCLKRAAGFEHVRTVERMPVPFPPGYIKITHSEWRKKEAA